LVIPVFHPNVSPRLRRILPVMVAALAVLATSASPASAATPCWKLLLNDWYDGTINNLYPIPCYHQAINHLPTDVQVYSSARDDILRALQQAVARQKQTKTNVTTVQPLPTTASTATTASTTTASTETTSTRTSTNIVPLPNTTTTTPKKHKGPISKALRDITPGGADSFPLPLLILGLIAILLVLAGIGGLFWRRYQGRGSTP
jgi:cobalamin biosynthesis Mg chelatase CobN